MTHGYEFFEFDYLDLDDYYIGDTDFWEGENTLDSEINELWGEIEDIYDFMEE